MNIENITEELKSFKTADEFVKFVDEYLTALLQAQANADALIQAERKLKAREVALMVVEEERDRLKQQLDTASAVLQVALQYVPKDKLQNMLMSQVLTASVISGALPGQGEDHKQNKEGSGA